MGSLEELTISKRRALELMGVQLYFERGLQPPPATQSEPGLSAPNDSEYTATGTSETARDAAVIEPSEQVPPASAPESTPPSAQPIRFDWVRSGGGLLCVDQLTAEYHGAIQDIVRYMDWRHGVESLAQLKRETFQWPQLTFTDTGPQRPLTVFFEKYAPNKSAWMIVDRYVADEVLTHLDGAVGTNVIVIDDLSQAITDPAAKRALWLKLAK